MSKSWKRSLSEKTWPSRKTKFVAGEAPQVKFIALPKQIGAVSLMIFDIRKIYNLIFCQKQKFRQIFLLLWKRPFMGNQVEFNWTKNFQFLVIQKWSERFCWKRTLPTNDDDALKEIVFRRFLFLKKKDFFSKTFLGLIWVFSPPIASFPINFFVCSVLLLSF